MEDIKELCRRIIIIDQGLIVYDGQLDDVIKKYAPYKELKIVFNGEGAKREAVEAYGVIDRYDPHAVTIRVEREKTKEAASRLLASDLPVDDILIDEMDISGVIRRIFKSHKT
jgi:ABC-2 type transport system ATP-binding protein